MPRKIDEVDSPRLRRLVQLLDRGARVRNVVLEVQLNLRQVGKVPAKVLEEEPRVLQRALVLLQRLVDIYDLRRREGPHRRAEQRAPHVHDERQVGKVDGCRVRVGVVEVGEPL